MDRTIGIVLLLTIVAAGCVSKKDADLEARRAYEAGQQQAAKQWQAQRPPEVVVQGPVHNPVIPWTEDLTLAQAIVAAEYDSFMNPKHIRVIRDGQMVEEMRGIDLLHHQDFPLQPGDIINIVP